MRISVVVPVLDDALELAGCLAALRAQTRSPDEIVVVDNGCSDSSAAVALEAGPPEGGAPRPGEPPRPGTTRRRER